MKNYGAYYTLFKNRFARSGVMGFGVLKNSHEDEHITTYTAQFSLSIALFMRLCLSLSPSDNLDLTLSRSLFGGISQSNEVFGLPKES